MLDVYQPFNGLGICSNVLKLSVQKKVSAVQTVLAMPLKQNCSHLNSLSYPCKKKKTIPIVSLFERLELPL